MSVSLLWLNTKSETKNKYFSTCWTVPFNPTVFSKNISDLPHCETINNIAVCQAWGFFFKLVIISKFDISLNSSFLTHAPHQLLSSPPGYVKETEFSHSSDITNILMHYPAIKIRVKLIVWYLLSISVFLLSIWQVPILQLLSCKQITVLSDLQYSSVCLRHLGRVTHL